MPLKSVYFGHSDVMSFGKKEVIYYITLLCTVAVSGHREEVRKVLQSCKNGQEVTDAELEEFIKPLIPKTDDEKCLMACAFKSYSIISAGTYDPRMALAIGKDLLKDEPEKAQKLKDVIAHCGDDVKKMDDECELASEIMQCLVKYEKAGSQSRAEYNRNTRGTGGLTLTPNMIVSGGKVAVKFLMNGIVNGLEGIIHGFRDILGNWIDIGFGIIRPNTR